VDGDSVRCRRFLNRVGLPFGLFLGVLITRLSFEATIAMVAIARKTGSIKNHELRREPLVQRRTESLAGVASLGRQVVRR